MNKVLEVLGVSCRHTDGGRLVKALDDVTLAVAPGELVAVMGPSGSGKSTLVHVACGLVPPSTGDVLVAGMRAPDARARPTPTWRTWWTAARREVIGVVHQRLNLLPTLSALENVALPLRLAGMAPGSARTQAAAALTEVGAADLDHQRADRLSIGQQQLVAIARAAAGERKLVLADEPTAALDTVSAERVVELLAKLAGRGVGVLMVTHDSRLASWADRVLVLRDGAIVDEIATELEPEPEDDAEAVLQ